MGNGKMLFVLFGMLISFSVFAGAVNAADITECGTVTENSVLVNDITSSETCLTIGANDITLDCAGHSITGDGWGALDTGIDSSGKTGNTIKNCTIQDFKIGIRLYDSKNNNILYNNINQNEHGIALFVVSSNNNIQANKISGSYFGVYVFYYSENNVITNNIISSNPWIGILFGHYAQNNLITNNEMLNNQRGIFGYTHTNNTIINNTLSSTEYDFYLVDDSHATTINTSFDKTRTGVSDTSTLTVQWYLDAKVTDENSNVIQGANANVFDINNNLEWTDLTDANGLTSKHVITEFVNVGGTVIYYTPHNVTASHANYADNSTLAIVDKSMTVPMVLSSGVLDTDGDGLTDAEEAAGWDITTYDCSGNPTGTRHVDSNHTQADEDGDGLTDLEERDGWLVKYKIQNPSPPPKKITIEYTVSSDPRNADVDSDGFNDADESQRKTDPNRADTDCDGAWDTNDKFEVDYGLNPLDADTDDDGITDGYEIDLWIEAMGYDPSVPELVPEEVLLEAVAKTNDPVMPAYLEIAPDTLNLKSNGNWITAYIELPVGSPEDIVLESVLLEGEIPAVTDTKYDFVTDENEYIVDSDGDGILERLVKFDRGQVAELLSPADEVTLSVTGGTSSGTFEATDTIRVIANGNNKTLGGASFKVNKKVKPVESSGDESRTKVTIDMITTGNQKVKAVSVKEYIPKELTIKTTDGAFTGFGLIWSVGTVEHKETLTYTLGLPEVSEPTTYELKTVVEYQTVEDLETLEKTSYLTVTPKGQVKLAEGDESKSVKAKGKGYSKVHWGRPSFKGGNGASHGKKKGHDKDKGKPDKPGNGGGNGGGKGGGKD